MFCGRPLIVAALAVVGSMALAPVATGEALSREEVRTRMVDDCVYSEWKSPARRTKAAKVCKCAAKKAVRTLKAEDLVAGSSWFGSSNSLTSAQRAALDKAVGACR